ncbi:hypothetical protein [Nocardiopsis kunsanensis]|uniref:Uncharacterized protein n=1 Tax=Nocardiopsis kunsanensis TaxID=141693 RepID=A0A919CFJ8_9ACTN|nr:hypothetical protein [Nocardiopsis kunsanensis]GHD16039.1 hypothetical protein GCM10007147_04080 [Nocardiopsis kunsanensis]
MSFTFWLSALALIAVMGLLVSIFAAGVVYAVRVRRQGIDSVLSGARKRRELRT